MHMALVTAIRCVEEQSVVNLMRVYGGLARGISGVSPPAPGRSGDTPEFLSALSPLLRVV